MKKVRISIIFILAVSLVLSLVVCLYPFENDGLLNIEFGLDSHVSGLGTELPPKTSTEVNNPGNSSEQYPQILPTDIPLSAENAIVFSVSENKTLFIKGSGDGKIYPASITKCFTSFVAMKYLSPDSVVTVGSELDLIRAGSSVAAISYNQRLTAEMLIEAMLLPSGNDAAYITAAAAGRVIADDDTLSAKRAVGVFVDEMNRQAKLYGMNNSHFTAPDGFHDPDHYTSLDDIVVVAKLALLDPTVSKYARLGRDGVVYESGETNYWKNTNKLLDPDSEFYCPDAIGLKTGYTHEAGNCLLSAFEKNGRIYIIGVFGSKDSSSRFTDTLNLYKAFCK